MEDKRRVNPKSAAISATSLLEQVSLMNIDCSGKALAHTQALSKSCWKQRHQQGSAQTFLWYLRQYQVKVIKCTSEMFQNTRKGAAATWIPVSPQSLEKAASICSQNKGRLVSQLLTLYSVELKGLFSLKAERFNQKSSSGVTFLSGPPARSCHFLQHPQPACTTLS